MFAFNFEIEQNEENDANNFVYISQENPNKSNEKIWFPAKEIIPNSFCSIKTDVDAIQETNLYKFNSDISLNYFTSDVTKLLNQAKEDCPALLANKANSDLVSGEYEGGCKIWQCTWDVLAFARSEKLDFKSKTVLDLGCGVGLLGTVALLNGSANVYFQDYNEEIVKHVTIPNIVSNCHDESSFNKCRFFCGDWKSFVDLMLNGPFKEHKCDYIVTSDTIYNPENYEKLHEVFLRCLKKDGVVYMGAVAHYFGVGGGIGLFVDFLKKKDTFCCSTCWENTDGLRRQIIKIEFKK